MNDEIPLKQSIYHENRSIPVNQDQYSKKL